MATQFDEQRKSANRLEVMTNAFENVIMAIGENPNCEKLKKSAERAAKTMILFTEYVLLNDMNMKRV